MRKILSKKFFNRDAFLAAEDLLGKYLVCSNNSEETAVMITEVEVYDGIKDKASHASKGMTDRNIPMFGEAGNFYVYLVYGIYNMLNIVCGEKGYPSAILIRGVKEISGPGRLTKYLKIDKNFNGRAAEPNSGLWFEDRGILTDKKKIKKEKRVGVEYAGPIWSEKLYRFLIEK
jgi:DNA-3-methyladenine glycosylase